MNKLAPADFENLVSLMQRAVEIGAEKSGAGKTCLTCLNFDEVSEICALGGKRPPARVIVSGCKSFDPSPF